MKWEIWKITLANTTQKVNFIKIWEVKVGQISGEPALVKYYANFTLVFCLINFLMLVYLRSYLNKSKIGFNLVLRAFSGNSDKGFLESFGSSATYTYLSSPIKHIFLGLWSREEWNKRDRLIDRSFLSMKKSRSDFKRLNSTNTGEITTWKIQLQL